MFNDQFVNVRWIMKRFGLMWLVVLINFLLYLIFAPFRKELTYSNPASVRYLSSISVPVLGCVAFRKLDGKLQFRW